LLVATWALWPSSPRQVSVALRPRASGFWLVAGGAF
jgi:hypothetical protein